LYKFILSSRSSDKFLDVLWEGGKRRGGEGTGERTKRKKGERRGINHY